MAETGLCGLNPRLRTCSRLQVRRERGYEKSPFGSTAAETAPAGLAAVAFPLRFPGQYFDGETGLNYNYFRDYDGTSGRYVKSDPVGLGGGINTYAYVEGNPVQYVDPLGHVRQGGKTGQWWEFTDRNFQRWFHQCWKQPGDQDATRAELAEAYATWVEWGMPDGKNGCGGPPPAPAPEPEACGDACKKTAKVVVVGGTAYIVYRCLRMLPSLLPPLWPTIPANAVMP
ncbi:RHS repeat-associated core domain-containing protein [Roseateles sp. SL47]|uniref:RHS repeat-associated core domain-containing protein n=1 Tax=Roseateles sp. SL47 TaxID=2995138 RepID=UPI003B637422